MRHNGSGPPYRPAANGHIIRIHPLGDTINVSQGRTVLATDREGGIDPGSHHGLFVHETRMLSRHQLTINGRPLHPVALSNVRQHSWLGYYIALPSEVDPAPSDRGSGLMEKLSEYSLEFRLSRTIGGGLHEDLDVVNFTGAHATFDLELALAADFADPAELHHGRQQKGDLKTTWRERDAGGELDFDYRAQHHFEHQGNRGEASMHRGLRVSVRRCDSPPTHKDGVLRFHIALAPLASWSLCLHYVPRIEGRELSIVYPCRAFGAAENRYEHARASFLEESTSFSLPGDNNLASIVAASVERSRQDLIALRLHDLDHPPHGWTMAAGLPLYVALFGRDTLTTAWQAALTTPDMMFGSARELALRQGTQDDPWRDEQPGRMLHEAHDGPLSVLGFNPRSRYYGAVTTSSFYPVVVSELWHWTGNQDLIYPLLGPAMKALESVDRYGDLNDDGFVDYQTRSSQGNRHQGWKDSQDAVVYADGTQVDPPIATCEEQGFLYGAKWQFAEVLWWMDKKDEARRLYREAQEMKQRFNDRFWMEEEKFFAFGLDSKREPIRAIVSNPGHCLATGIVESDRARQVADRLFQPDMFSGWGIRTLSSDNPAYNPYSYHRGSIWPVEHGAFAIGFLRFGLIEHLHRLAKAMFEATALFDFHRLPEVFSGHPRDAAHPFPAIYPKTNWPQAWSASMHFSLLQALLGIYPYAPLDLLLVDPQLPDWLPEIRLDRLRVGRAAVTLRFFRLPDGRSDYEILDVEGPLRVIRQPSPWSLSAGFGERLRDLAGSLTH